MNMDVAQEMAKMIPLASWVSLFALIISALSLYISIRNRNYERRLNSARKRTELMNRLSDNKITLATSLQCCKSARPILTEYQDQWQSFIPKIEQAIASIDEQYAHLKKCGNHIDPLKPESLTPGIYKALKESESLQIDVERVVDGPVFVMPT